MATSTIRSETVQYLLAIGFDQIPDAAQLKRIDHNLYLRALRRFQEHHWPHMEITFAFKGMAVEALPNEGVPISTLRELRGWALFRQLVADCLDDKYAATVYGAATELFRTWGVAVL